MANGRGSMQMSSLVVRFTTGILKLTITCDSTGTSWLRSMLCQSTVFIFTRELGRPVVLEMSDLATFLPQFRYSKRGRGLI